MLQITQYSMCNDTVHIRIPCCVAVSASVSVAGRLSAVTVLLCKLGNDGAKSGPEESWSVHGRKSGSYAESVMKQHLIHLNMQCMYKTDLLLVMTICG